MTDVNQESSQMQPDVTPVQTEATPEVTAPLPLEAQETSVKVPASIEEVIIYNQEDVSISVGMMIQQGDQLNIAIYKTAALDRALRPEMAPGLTQIKAKEAMKFDVRRYKDAVPANMEGLTPEVAKQ